MYQELVFSYFEKDSPLQKALSGFVARPGQQALASAIATAITNNEHIIAEAATGTGKTLAYIIPAILSKKKTLISTGTKTLQDQLFYKDLPIVQKTLKKPIKVALLKGRQNYICRYYLERNAEQATFASPHLVKQFQTILREHGRTRFGELSEIVSISEDESVRSMVTSTKDNCLGQECSFYNDCYVLKARRRALEADLVVINHHLLFADYGLKENGFGDLLPEADIVIIDEAHQLPEVATRFYGQTLSSRQFIDLTDDIEIEQIAHARDMKELSVAAKALQLRLKDLRIAMGDASVKAPWSSISAKPEIKLKLVAVQEAIDQLIEPLQLAAGRSKGLENAWERLAELNRLFADLTNATNTEHVHWYETFAQSFLIHHSPLSIAKSFQETLSKLKAVFVFTSATLAIKQDFTYYQTLLGFDTINTIYVKSPFNYQNQALLYLPRGLPDPNHQHYLEKLIAAAVPVINAAQGRTFFLFTSYHALNYAASVLPKLISYPLLIQGTQAKEHLLQQFIQSGNSVLLATASFWEGVDVRGEALSCVIIDKLPFSAPTDPIQQARSQHLKQQGKHAFYECTLPHAVIMLKQGAGRLIRDENDKGILMIGDPRMVAKEYGQVFVESLSDFPRTRDLQKVQDFF